MQKKRNPLIFVVEDNKIYNKLVVNFLEKNGYTNVRSFYSGEDCLRNLKQNPMVVIQDYLLEGVNGITVLKKAKKLNPETEFIFLSGQDNMEVAINTMKYGAFDYIIKDKVTLDKVLDKISKIIALKKLGKSHKQTKAFMLLFLTIIVLMVIFFITYFFTDIFGVNW